MRKLGHPQYYRKTSTQWLLGDWEGLSGPKLKAKLSERMASSAEGRKRFWSKAAKGNPDECWEWTGGFDDHGYGKFCFTFARGKNTYLRAHRLSYFLTHGGPLAEAVCHKCDNPKCVNPGHLFLGTRMDNNQDMVSKSRQAVGRKIHTTKLTPRQVQRIRILNLIEGVSTCQLAKIYGVVSSTIWSAVNGVNWKHLPFPKEILHAF